MTLTEFAIAGMLVSAFRNQSVHCRNVRVCPVPVVNEP